MLEQAIAELTAAMKALTAMLAGTQVITAEIVPRAAQAAPGNPTPPSGFAPSQTAAAPTAPAAPAPIQPTAGASAAPAQSAQSSAAQPDFKTEVVPAFQKLLEVKGEPAGYEIIHAFKPGEVRLSKALQPSDYRRALDMINAALAA